ncbi:MAG: thymidine phosphorylase [Acidobacteriota bacterium]
MTELIEKKKRGGALSTEELRFIVTGSLKGDIPDYQLAALFMAIRFKGMNQRETTDLTREMLNSGQVLELSSIPGKKIDKHSTGGVGDKVSLILAPLVASAGVVVPMLSGRGLGHTGGTLDKLESIPGFHTTLPIPSFLKQLSHIGVGIIGQSEEIAPADRLFYALRDVTGTVDSIPLITASILSKKLAEGAEGYVFDVKVGQGAFMRTMEDARALSSSLVSVSSEMGKKASALITSMEQTLGEMVGNALEVKESIDVLKGKGPADLIELTLQLGAEMLLLAGMVRDIEGGLDVLKGKLQSGEALDRFREMVSWQGGDSRVVDDYRQLPQAKGRWEMRSPSDGYISMLDAYEVGLAVKRLGGGRESLQQKIDPSAGIRCRKKMGEWIGKGEILMEIYYNNSQQLSKVIEGLSSAVELSEERVALPSLIREKISL